jgi:hypothetical protein
MRIDGEWYECDDGLVRPIIRGEILTKNGFWEPTPFLVDTGADRTVFSAAILEVLGFEAATGRQGWKLGGLGGLATAVEVETKIRLSREGGGHAHFIGTYAAVTQLEALDMSVLGRDITEMFAVIVDRTRNVVSLLRDPHRYYT